MRDYTKPQFRRRPAHLRRELYRKWRVGQGYQQQAPAKVSVLSQAQQRYQHRDFSYYEDKQE
jgi:hypothetical protein